MELGKALYLLQIGGKMETKEIEVNNKKYKIKSLNGLEGLDLFGNADKINLNKELLKMCVEPSLTEEKLKELDWKEVLEVLREVNKINKFEEESKDFQISKV